MSVAIIINPKSGTGGADRGRRRAELASQILLASGEEGEVFVTTSRGHGRELAAAAVRRGARLVIAWGGDGTTSPPVTPPGFSVSLSATTLTVEQGATGTITATVTRTGSFTGAVEVLVEGLPAGITATLAPSTIGSGTTTGTLSIAVGAAVAAGSYNFIVRARGSGLADQTF